MLTPKRAIGVVKEESGHVSSEVVAKAGTHVPPVLARGS